MAVPAHDERDFEFAQQFGIDIKAVVDPGNKVSESERAEVLAGMRVFSGDGVAISSCKYNGLTTTQFKQQITADLASHGLGRQATNYKLRDWLFSRQRFWGEPFPILHELDANGKPTGRVRAVDEKDLPVDLPHLEDFKPHGRPEPPLDKAPAKWLYPVIDGKRYKRETNTMPQWAGSCWYYLRFLDPKDDRAPIDPAIEKAWMPVDLYIGGAEHAVLHLLYARFWHKVLYDRGVVSMPEPFQKLINQGMILGENNEKMSKSRGNVINPDTIVTEYGADSLRLYEMFMGPLEAAKPWNMQGVNGVFGFLNRVWRLILDERADTIQLNAAVVDRAPNAEENRVLHQTIQAVTNDIRNLAFNTAISRMMEFTNHFTAASERRAKCSRSSCCFSRPSRPTSPKSSGKRSGAKGPSHTSRGRNSTRRWLRKIQLKYLCKSMVSCDRSLPFRPAQIPPSWNPLHGPTKRSAICSPASKS